MRNNRALGYLATTHGINDLYQGAVPALLPFLMAERGYNYVLIAGITLAATALSSVLQPLFGVLTDRRSMSWLVPGGMVLAGLGVGACGLGDSYAWTWVAIALSGIGLAAYHPAAAKAARAVGGPPSKSMSLFAVGGSVGVAVAPLLVAFVLDSRTLSGTWLLAVPAVVMGVVYCVAHRGTGDLSPAAASASATAPAQDPGRDDWRAFAVMAALAVCWSMAFVVMGAFAALNVIERFEVTTALGSATLTAFTVGGIVGTLAGGWSAERWGRLRTIRYGYLFSAVAMAGVVTLPDLSGVLVSTLALGTLLFVPFAAQITVAQDYLPNRVGTASGLTLGLTASVGGLLAPAFGAVADGHGVQAMLSMLVVVLAAGCLVAWRLPEPAPHAPRARAEAPASR